jgi:hypothetical protein
MAFQHYRGEGEPRFAHPKERELAQLLDAHGIAWQYEPHTFPLAHHPDGKVSQAITPDFYLPEIGAYVECTAMKQQHTRRKRQKVRKVTRIYGEVVTLLCRRDLQRLRQLYGRGA